MKAFSMTSRSKQAEAVKPQLFVPVDGQHFSTQEFYDQVESDLRARRVPRLRSKRVEFHEGSRLSDKRLYLRLARERFSFELCAAPFGSGYFFTLRYVEVPRGGWVMLILLLAAVGITLSLLFLVLNHMLYHASGWFWIGLGVADVAAIVGLVAYRARKDANNPPDPLDKEDPVTEMPDFDAFMLGLPVIGEWYERIRKETYYRYDTRLMYQTIVSEIVERRVEELVATKGVKLMRPPSDDASMGDFFRNRTSTSEA
jgi:hypothetical protein